VAARRRKGLAATSSEEATGGSHRSAVAAGPDKSGYSEARDPAAPELRLCEATG